MGALCEEAISAAVKLLVDNDVKMKESVLDADKQIDQKERDIETLCMKLLMQQQPVARDLRTISAALKMVTDMERIGDHAADISEITVMLAEKQKTKRCDTIVQMATEASNMLIQSIDAFARKNREVAQHVIEHDDVVDELFDKAKSEIIELIQKDPERGEQELDMLMIAKYLERIGDHATNIVEWVIYAL